jgi:Fe-S cluster assembly scaffold protein SufB
MNQELRIKNKEIVIHTDRDATYIIEENVTATVLILLASGQCSITVRLVGPGANARIIGVGILAGTDQTVLHTLQHHEAPQTSSNLLVKAVLSGSASLIYDGAIRVDKKAQKTDAYQRNENLLLSGQAHAESKPSLEILANDVRCTHGATIGTVDSNQLFYLKTRGINEFAGKRLLVQGFLEAPLITLSDTIQTNWITPDSKRAIIGVKEKLWQTLSKQLR